MSKASVKVQVIGGQAQDLQANNVGEVKSAMNAGNYTASVNGQPQDDGYQLREGDFITLGLATKGGR